MNSPARSKPSNTIQTGLSFIASRQKDPMTREERARNSIDIKNDGSSIYNEEAFVICPKYDNELEKERRENLEAGNGYVTDAEETIIHTSYYFQDDYSYDVRDYSDETCFNPNWIASEENYQFYFGVEPNLDLGWGFNYNPLSLDNFSLLPDQQNPDGSPSLLGQTPMSFASPLTNPFGGGMLTGAFSSATNPPAQASNAPQFESSEPQATEPPKPVALAPIPNPFQMSA